MYGCVYKLTQLSHAYSLTSCVYRRPVCDAAVKVLDVYNEMICCELLKLIKATIGGVDYKACWKTVLLFNITQLSNRTENKTSVIYHKHENTVLFASWL